MSDLPYFGTMLMWMDLFMVCFVVAFAIPPLLALYETLAKSDDDD